MALTAQNVVDQVSQDMRKVLSNTGNDAATLLTYVDRIHKDALHSSVYSHLNRKVTTQALISGTSNYTLGVSDIRRILAVYNRSQQRYLNPLLSSAYPPEPSENTGDPRQQPPMPQTMRDELISKIQMSRYAEYYMKVGSTGLYVFPTPVEADTLEVHYESQVATVAALATTLTIPEDGLDMLVAGVNYLTASYLKRGDEAAQWKAIYEQLKRGEMVV